MSGRPTETGTRLKYLCHVNPLPPRVPDDQEVSFIPMEAIGERGGIRSDARCLAGAVKKGYTGFRNGDVVLAKITPCFENGKGTVVEGMSAGVGFGTTELHVLRPEGVDRRWLFYVTQSEQFMGLGEGAMYGAGGQKRVPPDFVRNYRAWTPSLPAQTAIADFLDRKTAAIDALIDKKQQLIGRLEEKRAALINQVVTKGLDPSVPMKDSGIPWIGEIPAHWEVKRLKTLAHFTTSGSRGWADHCTEDDSDPVFLQSGNLGRHLEVDLSTSQRVAPPPGAEGQRTLVAMNDVLVCITGARTGAVAVVTKAVEPRAFINQHVCLVRLVPTEANPVFIGLSLSSDVGQAQFQTVQYGGTKQGLGLADVRDCGLAVPPKREQDKLAGNVSTLLARSRKLEERVGRNIERLREYRQALITAAVTGQIDVEKESAS